MIKDATIIFDMDGVLVDTETISLEANRQAAKEACVEVDVSVWFEMIGKRIDECKKILFDYLDDDRLSELLWKRANELYYNKITAGDFELKRGVEALLDFLDSNGIVWGVGTSSEASCVGHKLKRLNILERAHCIVSGDCVSLGKPSPDIYLEAARRLKVPVHECLVLEDSGPGLMAAHSAGMYPVLIPDIKMPEPRYCALAKNIFESLDAFLVAFSQRLN